jgi:hypothetical protein
MVQRANLQVTKMLTNISDQACLVMEWDGLRSSDPFNVEERTGEHELRRGSGKRETAPST